MEEFLNHYIHQGVDHFYIVNNGSNDNIEEVIEKSDYKSNITLITDNRNLNILTDNSGGAGHKLLLDEHFYNRIKEETEWAIIIDADEFMYGKNGYTIRSYLSTIDKNIGCIYVIWNIINPNKDSNNNLLNDFSIKKNVKRLNYDSINNLSWLIKNANDFGKSIIRTSMLMDDVKLLLHKIHVNGKMVNNYGINKNNFDNCNMIEYSEANYKKINITLNHYAIRNLEDYEKKKRQIHTVSYKNDFIFGLLEMLELDDSFFVVDDYIATLS